ncbi:hypothetical protein PHYBLDRAFT_140099 [Phycomyces blakesleeanus NRRL 1555(-)]|uniref:Uncharacterized protein n=1 Tax=Phycomyces blakesleeanus (strain ATCC 8743b / DSM 1359 / FGSC 10004 / NBRC 33097 / NRRL 1555) TaxID=763407 RepID=A0A162YDN3_PHYB8|nr:hypothetical protein PHYBLDRAFT_140099 [Phycomyces blakesleeanus NRRL 1555(-)]OAD80085.1 hypothetical protein PHYBLDRAFT_140099 [Phycomyces blakesleeanus NRRL 1555(-)]|eukprot:XP_018298125.1 hypothetical protein PHYBLDRAFT_140099 [Phycomyces blakesleeanus NRRL 1555(-)]
MKMDSRQGACTNARVRESLPTSLPKSCCHKNMRQDNQKVKRISNSYKPLFGEYEQSKASESNRHRSAIEIAALDKKEHDKIKDRNQATEIEKYKRKESGEQLMKENSNAALGKRTEKMLEYRCKTSSNDKGKGKGKSSAAGEILPVMDPTTKPSGSKSAVIEGEYKKYLKEESEFQTKMLEWLQPKYLKHFSTSANSHSTATQIFDMLLLQYCS